MILEPSFTRDWSPMRDREVIRVNFANDNLGIAASLRQAFSAAARDQSTRDFEQLLSELD